MTLKSKIINSSKELTNIYSLTALGMLLAIRTIFGIVANPTMTLFGNTVKISFDFIPVTIAAILFGPVGAGIIGATGDILSFIINPVGGSYFPGFTINGFFMGFIFGLFLYKNNTKTINVIFAYLVNAVFVDIFLSAYWFHILYGDAYIAYLLTRIVSEGILSIPTVILMITFCKVSLRIPIKSSFKK